LLVALAEREEPAKQILEPDDGRSGGWTHREFASALARAVGRRAISFSTPGMLLRFGAVLDRLIRRGRAKLTADRAAYFCHPDWAVSSAFRPPSELWMPQIATDEGLAATAEWYRAQGWL
jgi:nucleoside-diphosphate-sugar epimerase